MPTTDVKGGFRLPWSSDRTNANPETTETEAAGAAKDTLWPATDTAQGEPRAATPPATAGHHVTPSEGTVPASISAAPVARRPPAKPTKFLADLTRAMQAAAEASREQTLSQFQADSKTFVDLIHERTAGEAAALKAQADADIDGIRAWSKAEIARIREETEAKIAARRVELDQQVEQHAARIERQIEMVHGSVSAFEREMAAFFEELLQETDPARFAALAETLPEPPNFEDILPEAFLVDPGSDAAAGDVEAADETEAPDEHIETGEAALDAVADPGAAVAETTEEAPAEAEAADATAEQVGDEAPSEQADDGSSSADFDAAEAEAALAARMESMGEDGAGGTGFVDRLSSIVPADDAAEPDGEVKSTQVVVVGLVSVASIASFKRHLGRMAGVQAVGVSSGPDGEFVFTVSHNGDVQLRDAIPTLPTFGARITSSGEGVVHVTARDPEADA
jgi:hypothetical protein